MIISSINSQYICILSKSKHIYSPNHYNSLDVEDTINNPNNTDTKMTTVSDNIAIVLKASPPIFIG